MARKKETRKKRTNTVSYFDYSLLSCFGLVMLYITSAYSALVSYGDSMHYFKRQILFCIVGFIGMYIVMKIDYHVYIKWAKPIYFCCVFRMLLVKRRRV